MSGCARAGPPPDADAVRSDEPDDPDRFRLRLPAETAAFDGDPVIYQVEHVYRWADLSAAERRDGPLSELVEEYDDLAADFGTDAPALIDGEPRATRRAVHGVLHDRTGNLASVYPLVPEAERRVVATLADGDPAP